VLSLKNRGILKQYSLKCEECQREELVTAVPKELVFLNAQSRRMRLPALQSGAVNRGDIKEMGDPLMQWT
jgi:hypothetical protein